METMLKDSNFYIIYQNEILNKLVGNIQKNEVVPLFGKINYFRNYNFKKLYQNLYRIKGKTGDEHFVLFSHVSLILDFFEDFGLQKIDDGDERHGIELSPEITKDVTSVILLIYTIEEEIGIDFDGINKEGFSIIDFMDSYNVFDNKLQSIKNFLFKEKISRDLLLEGNMMVMPYMFDLDDVMSLYK